MNIRKFMPDEAIKHVYELNYPNLRKDGFDTIIFDLDNTLAPYSELEPTKELRFFIEHLKQLGYRVLIASNSKMPRVAPFLKGLDVDGIAPALKPFGFRIKKAFGANPKTTVFIGDQLMTDVWMSKNLQFYTVLVNPIVQKQDKWVTRINRMFERRILNKIKQNYQEYYETVLKERYER